MPKYNKPKGRKDVTKKNVDNAIKRNKKTRGKMRKVGMNSILMSDAKFDSVSKTKEYRGHVREIVESDQSLQRSLKKVQAVADKVFGKENRSKLTKIDKENEKATQAYARKKRKKT